MEADILSLENETNEKNPHLKTFFNRNNFDCDFESKNKKNQAKTKNNSIIDVSKNMEPKRAGTINSLPLLNLSPSTPHKV